MVGMGLVWGWYGVGLVGVVSMANVDDMKKEEVLPPHANFALSEAGSLSSALPRS